MPDARSEILGAMRRSLADAGARRQEPHPISIDAFSPDDWDAFAAAVARTGAKLTIVDDWAAAREAVRGVLQEENVRQAGMWNHPDLAPLDLPALFDEVGVETVDGKDGLASAQLGITAVHGALAESGSLLVAAGADTPRSTSLLPEAHLAIVPPGRMVPDIPSLAPFMRYMEGDDGRLPSAITAISGPSSTGDIEMVVVKGVHGPVRVHIVAVRGA